MKSFEESGYHIQFEQDWQVLKLDESRFYTYLSGRNFKCVDFLAMHQDFGMFLIELKNYVDPKNIPTHDEIEDIILFKSEDSLHLIEIVEKYFSRKALYRWANKYPMLFKVLPREWKFWYEVNRYYKDERVTILGDIEW